MMQGTQDLVARAGALGEALAANPTVMAHYEAQKTMRADASAQQVLRDYQEQLNKIQQAEAGNVPIEVNDKHKLKELETAMAGNEALKALMRTQADYVALMNQINQAMDAPLAKLSRPESAE